MILTVLLFALLSWGAIALLQYLWNITMPDLFSLRRLSFWQTFRLLLIILIVGLVLGMWWLNIPLQGIAGLQL